MAAILSDDDLQTLAQQEADRQARLQAAIAPPATMAPAALPAPVTPVAAPKAALIPPPPPLTPQAAPVTLPAVSPRVGADQAELDRLRATGSGIDQLSRQGFGHKLIAGLARVGDIAGSALFPTVMATVPGTGLHHQVLLNRAQGNVQSDLAAEKEQTETAKAAADLNAPATPEMWKELTNFQGANGEPVLYNEHTGEMRMGGGALGIRMKPQKVADAEQPLGDKIPQLNAMLEQRYQVLHPGQKLPAQYQVPGNATAKDYDRIDKGMEAEERATGTAAQQATANEMRRQTLALSQQAAADRKAMQGGIPYEQMTPQQQQLVDQVGSGKMALSRMDYLLSRNPGLLAAVAQKYPDFDSSKIKSYVEAQRDFTGSGKISTQLNAGSTALRHLAQLKSLNDANPTAVHNPLTESYKQYNNLLDTVADELITFYGEPKTNEAINSKKSTLGGMLNRGAAITEQASAMGVKFDELENTWKNAAPSQAYQAPMPGYSQAAKQARAKLDPNYAARLRQESSGGGQPAPAGASDEVYVNGKLAGHVVNGAYVPLGGGK